MASVSLGMAHYLGGLPNRPKLDEGSLWFDAKSVGFGDDGVSDALISVDTISSVVVEQTLSVMSLNRAWTLASVLGILGVALSRRPLRSTSVAVHLRSGDIAVFRLASFDVPVAVRLLDPWLVSTRLGSTARNS